MRRWIWISGLSLSCGPDTDALVEEMSEWGAFSVGYTETEVSYAPQDGSSERTLRLATWYPSLDVSGVETKYQGLFNAPNVWENASVAEGAFPLVVYSHGHQGYAEASSYLMSFFASHGFVVAAPDHTGNTTFDGSNRDTSIYYLRMMDISAVIDHMEEESPSPLTGDVVGFGHSFGGYTMFGLAGGAFDVESLASSCEESEDSGICSNWSADAAAIFEAGLKEPRIDAFVSMAAGDVDKFGVAGLKEIEASVLMMDGELDPATGGSSGPIWEGLEGRGNTRVHILGGGHQTFSDMSGILETFEGLIDADAGNHILQVYGMSFMRQRMGQKGYEAILSGEYPVSEQVILSQ